MKQAFRMMTAITAGLLAYFFVLWIPMLVLRPLHLPWWIGSILSLACAIWVGRYIWLKSEAVPDGLG